MAQRSQMFYAYFRFYIDESQIETGLDQYCTEWEHMFEVGYNYKEYKCYVDNLGGFEHFVGDMRGYISQTRETGFLDGSPSDAIYDTSLTMGASKATFVDFLMLNGIKRNTAIYFRKITAQDAGVAHKIKLVCGDASITHPVMYTLDMSQIEILKPNAVIVDSSDVDSYEFTADTQATMLIGTQHSLSGGTITDPDNMWDYDNTTYTKFDGAGASTYEVVYNMGATFNALAIDLQNHWNAPRFGSTYVYVSNDAVSWTLVDSIVLTHTRKVMHNNNLADSRYVKIKIVFTGGQTPRCDMYAVVTS